MKFQLVEKSRLSFTVKKMCLFLNISKSGYYAWRSKATSARKTEDARLKELILKIFHEHKGRRGAPMIMKYLKDIQVHISKKRVARLMKELGLSAHTKKRFRPQTTDSNHNLSVSPNLLKQNFTADAPNKKWVSDITYIGVGDRWIFLCTIMDLFNREIIGWTLADHMKTSMLIEALESAIQRKNPDKGTIFHSDQGVQYASNAFRSKLTERGFIQSMSRRGNCYDNSVMESFFHTLKNEEVNKQNYKNNFEARASIFEYIEVYYNRIRKHSTLDYQTPIQVSIKYAA